MPQLSKRSVGAMGAAAHERGLLQNWEQIERRVREVLVAAAQKLPPGEDERRVALARLYDPTDEDRGNVILEKFKEIKDAGVRKRISAKIAGLAGE